MNSAFQGRNTHRSLGAHSGLSMKSIASQVSCEFLKINPESFNFLLTWELICVIALPEQVQRGDVRLPTLDDVWRRPCNGKGIGWLVT